MIRSAPPTGHGRRQRVPPALTRGGPGFEGLDILSEIPGDLGVVLWRSMRNVMIWAYTPAGRRAGLFDPAAADARAAELARMAPDAELLAPLSVIVALLESPERVEVPRLVNACRRVALWAEARGALGTALDFAQAAALAQPDAASLAFAVGRLARRRAEYDRAESWYTRAIVQGRQSGDWRSYALAFSGLGNMYVQRGNYPKARRAHIRTLRAARRHGLADLQGDAYHALFALQIETGAGPEADVLAARAFEAYGPAHPKVARLGYDVAYHWALRGLFAGALSVAEALVPHFEAPAERALVFGLLARAAGGAGARASFERAEAELRTLLAMERSEDSAARAHLGLSYGASSLGEWTTAIHAGTEAVRIASARREGKVLLEAEAALQAVRHHVQPPVAPVPGEGENRPLADSFVRALTSAGGVCAAR